MFDFISRDSVLEQIMELPSMGCATYDADSVENIIRFEPAADVVEVVRCEKCSQTIGEVNRIGGIYCDLHKGWFDKDAFCSYGERRVSIETD